MKPKLEIEAGLDRSLEKGIGAPQLDASFNAAVWARIAASEARVPVRSTVAPGASRWLLASNIVGIAVSLALICYFIARSFSIPDVELELPLASLSEHAVATIVTASSYVIAVAAVGYGLTFTPFGRRVRNIFR